MDCHERTRVRPARELLLNSTLEEGGVNRPVPEAGSIRLQQRE